MNSRDIIRSLMTNSKSVISFKTSDGRFTLVNQKWVDRYGVEPHEIVGRTFFGAYSEEIAAEEHSDELRVEEKNESLTVEEQRIESDGLHFYLTNRFPVHDGDGVVIGNGMISTEITTTKRLAHDLERSQEDLQKLALFDPLTGVYNRATFYEKAEIELLRHRRYHHPMVVLLIKLDHLKKLNSRFGSQRSDEVLVQLVQRMRSVLRDTDLLFRMGGGEFSMVAQETDIDGGEHLAEKLVEEVCREEFPVVKLITVSVGVVQVVEGDDLEQLLARGHGALVQAKEQGGNCVVVEQL